MKTFELKDYILGGKLDETINDIYVDGKLLDYQKTRYMSAIQKYEDIFGEEEVFIFSAPGRSEVGGNHTDHQHGQVLAASINLDAIAVVSYNHDSIIRIVSDGFEMIEVEVADMALDMNQKETTTALIKGMNAGLKERNYKVGGFNAYITSDVLIGAGLSSSAAFETLIGTIISHMFNDGQIDSVTIAMVGQYAENVYFGKPCGLMDQMACSVGNLVHIDFENPKNPLINKVDFDLNSIGYSLCITDTLGSHADLTMDYKAVPDEMCKVASYFGRDVLRGVTINEFITNIGNIRKNCSDRAALRAFHFICENERVSKEVAALEEGNIDEFLYCVTQSGNSSFKYLQNVYSNLDVSHQNVSVALAMSEFYIQGKKAATRVHGGGFAGTIQTFIDNDSVGEYQEKMNELFGENSCKVLRVRKYGGIKVVG